MFIQVTRLVMGEKVVQHVNTGQIVYIAPMTRGCELVLGNRERWQVVESAEEVLMKMTPHPLPLSHTGARGDALETRTASQLKTATPKRKGRKDADQ